MQKSIIKHLQVLATFGILSAGISTSHAASVLFNETFEGVDTGYYNASCGYYCSHSIQSGVPLANGGTDINGADENWYGARFERPDGGRIDQDIGVQEYGGGTSGSGYNGTHVALIEDDAGLMFRIDTTGYENVSLSFDWRTFVAGSRDRFVVGYYIGDLLTGLSEETPGSRTYDLRNAAHGGTDGDYNWDPINGGNEGNWNELMRSTRSNSWDTETFNLSLASDTSEVWIAFWLDNGEADIGKFDNVVVMGDAIAVVPVPAAAWLFGSGLIGLASFARRKTS